MIRRCAFLVLLTAATVHRSSAQDAFVSAFASQVRTDVAMLASQPTLAAWQKSHATDKLDLAHYDTSRDPYEVDFARLSRWCAASVNHAPAEVVRAALFYVPPVAGGVAPLTGVCQMQAIWYETHSQASLDAVVRELSSSWGQPNGPSAQPDIGGCGYWRGTVTWHREGMNVWVVYDPKGKPGGAAGPRLIVYARRDSPGSFDISVQLLGPAIGTQAVGAAAQIAAQDSKLTAAVLTRSQCDTTPPAPEAESLTASHLTQWLSGSNSLPPQRRAAALLVADSYVACARIPSAPLIQLGAAFRVSCPQDGPTYSHNFRDQADKLDPKGPAGELAGLLSLADPCSLKGTRPWPDLVIERGEKLLIEFPGGKWTAWADYAIARAHAAKLSFASPGAPEEERAYLSAAAMQQERSAAIEHFKRFMREQPDAPESVFAWQETWRLLAGLPPSQIHFGCGCE